MIQEMRRLHPGIKLSILRGSMIKAFLQFQAHLRSPLYRNSYALMLGSATTSTLGLVYWILAARFYSPQEVGLNSATLSGAMFLSGISLLSLDGALVRYVPIAGIATPRLVGIIYLVCTTGSALASMVFLVGVRWWSPQLRFLVSSPFTILFFTLATMAWSVFTLEDSVLAGLRQAIWVPIENTIFALVKIALLVAFVGNFRQLGIFASWMVPVIALLLPVNLLIFKRLVPRHIHTTAERTRPRLPDQVIKYVSGNYAGALFFLAFTTLLPVLVTEQAGAQANAYFYLPWTIMNALQLVSMSMTTSFTVEATIERTQRNAYFRRSLIHTARLITLVLLVILPGAPYFLLAFGPDYSAQGTGLLRLLVLAAIPNLVVWLYLGMARVQNQTLGIVLVQGTLCASMLSLTYFLLPRLGINGIGIAWLVSQSLVAVVLVVSVLRPVLWERV